MPDHPANFVSSSARMCSRHIILVGAACLLVAACKHPQPAKPPASGAKKPAQAASASNPAQTLAGRWHVNKAGEATKQFTPAKGTFLHGRADGFWPDGGEYEVSEVNAGKRSLHLRVTPLVPDPDDHFQTRSGPVTFTADGKHMTWTRHIGNGIPDETTTYYRVP